MADTRKLVALQFEAGGGALQHLRDLQSETKKLIELRNQYVSALNKPMPIQQQFSTQQQAAGVSPIFHQWSVSTSQAPPIQQRMAPEHAEIAQRRSAAAEQAQAKGAAATDTLASSFGKASLAVGGAVAALKAMESGMRFAAQTINTFSNASLTAQQKQQRFLESLPVVGGAFSAAREFRGAVSGETEVGRQLIIKRQQEAMQIGLRGEAERGISALAMQNAEAQARHIAFSGQPGAGGLPGVGFRGFQQPGTARGTLLEQVQYGEARQLLPHETRIRQGEAEADAARIVRDKAASAVAKTEREVADLERRATPITGNAAEHGITDADRGITQQQRAANLAAERRGLAHAAASSNPYREATTRGQRAIRYAGAAVPGAGPLGIFAMDAMYGGDIFGTEQQPGRQLATPEGRRAQYSPITVGGVGARAGIGAAAGNQANLGMNAHDDLIALEKATRQMNEQNQLVQKRQTLEQQINALKDSQANAATKEAQQRENLLEKSRQELELLKQREQVAQTNAQRLGGMNRFERTQAVNALEQLQKTGVENAPQFLKDLASKVAPRTVGNLYEQAGEKSEDFKRLQRLAPGEYRDRLQDIRGRVDVREAQVGRAEDVNLQKNAEAFANKLAPLFVKMGDNINKIVDAKINEWVARQRLGNAAQPAGK